MDKKIETWGNLGGFFKTMLPSGSLPRKIEMNLREDGINYDMKMYLTVNDNGTKRKAIVSAISALPANIELKMEYEECRRDEAEMWNIVISEDDENGQQN